MLHEHEVCLTVLIMPDAVRIGLTVPCGALLGFQYKLGATVREALEERPAAVLVLDGFSEPVSYTHLDVYKRQH